MFSPRYEIQRKHPTRGEWTGVQRAYTKKNAGVLWWAWVNQPWQELFIFRIIDTRTGKEI